MLNKNNCNMKTENKENISKSEILERISTDRQRTNLLRKPEQLAIAYLVKIVPRGISSNGLTAIGLFGNFTVFLSFVLAKYVHVACLLISLLGFAINWFGDSLDGRIAYFRKVPRKNYGFALDITIDWIGIILIGLGYIVYADGFSELLGYGFVVLYGWEMIIMLMKYKITGKYSIDSGIFGPTEVRMVIALILILELIIRGSIAYSAGVIVLILLLANISDTRKLLKLADEVDIEERNRKQMEEQKVG
jgi:hypothetical protein